MKPFLLVTLIIFSGPPGTHVISTTSIVEQFDQPGECMLAQLRAEREGHVAGCIATNPTAFNELAAAMAHEAGLHPMDDY